MTISLKKKRLEKLKNAKLTRIAQIEDLTWICLQMLTRELEGVKDERGVTDYDVLHMENKKAGRDKYKTLRQIRGGNTKRRIDQYENM